MTVYPFMHIILRVLHTYIHAYLISCTSLGLSSTRTGTMYEEHKGLRRPIPDVQMQEPGEPGEPWRGA